MRVRVRGDLAEVMAARTPSSYPYPYPYPIPLPLPHTPTPTATLTLQKVMAARTTSCALCCSRLHTVCSSCTEVCTIASRARYAYTWWGVAQG